MYSPFYRRTFAIATAVVLGYVMLLLLEPLRGALGWAAVLAFLLHPLHDRLSRRLKGRASLSAGILTALTPFFVLAPLSVLGIVFAGQVANLITYLRGRSFVPYPEMIVRLEGFPVLGTAVRWIRANAAISAEQIQGWVTDSVQTVLKSAAAVGGNIALGLFGTVVGFLMMLFLLFFFLQDGRSMLIHLQRLIPMEREQREKLLNYLADVTRAVVFGSTATALLQGIFVAVGFAIVGLPSPVVFGVLATLAAFLPTGSAVVLIPAIIYLAAVGRWGAAIFLAVWSAAMWVAENVLRPLLTAHRAEVSTLAVFVGAVGGASAFGILGLLIGPVLLSFAVALVRFAEDSV